MVVDTSEVLNSRVSTHCFIINELLQDCLIKGVSSYQLIDELDERMYFLGLERMACKERWVSGSKLGIPSGRYLV